VPQAKPFSREERQRLLDEAFQLMEDLEDLELDYEAAGDEGETIGERIDQLSDRLDVIREEYLKGLPRVRLSRCPFCRKELVYPIDTLGIDGLWWNRDEPVRPEPENWDPHFFGLTGAVKLQGELPDVPFLAMPGPEVPYVIPRLMRLESIRAVISSLPIGQYTGYPIAYYANPIAEDVLRPDTWGLEKSEYLGPEGNVQWCEADDLEEDNDYDLRRWIATGRLLWIAPNDAAWALQQAPSRCPYVDLKGRREVQRVQNGEAWALSEAADAPDEPEEE